MIIWYFQNSILAILMDGNLLPLFYFTFTGYQREGSILISLLEEEVKIQYQGTIICLFFSGLSLKILEMQKP